MQQPLSASVPLPVHGSSGRLPCLISVIAVLTVALPWLNPAAGGPSAVIQPWLVAAAVMVLAWHFVAPAVAQWQLGSAIMVAALLAWAGQGAPPVLLAVGGLVVIAVSAAVASSASTRPWILDTLLNAWLVAALASGVFALAQYLGLSAHLAPWINPTEPGEAFANLRQRNQFATLTSIGLASLMLRVRQGANLAWILPAAALLATANAASASRTGVLQIALLVVLALWWGRPIRRRAGALCAVAVVAYGLAAVLLPIALHQLTGASVPNAFGRLASADGCSSRIILWGNVLHLIAQRPWWGWGWGELDFAHFATLYPGPRFCDILDNAHNLPLHLAVELGVPMAVLACAGFAWWLMRQQPWHEADGTRQLAWSVIGVILLHSLLEYPLWYGPFQMAFGFGLGLLAQCRAVGGPRPAGSFARGAVSAVLTMALVYSAWDYHRVSQLYTVPGQRSILYQDRALPRIGDSWLFRDQLAFAELSITPLTRENAPRIHALAMALLHYSPEPRVVEIAIESAMWIGREDQALWLLARLRAAFPKEAASLAKALPAPAASGVEVRP